MLFHVLDAHIFLSLTHYRTQTTLFLDHKHVFDISIYIAQTTVFAKLPNRQILSCCENVNSKAVLFHSVLHDWELSNMRSALFWYVTHRSVVFRTDVSKQPVGPIFEGQEVLVLLGFLGPWRWGWWVVPKRRYWITTLRRVTYQKSADLINIVAEAWNQVTFVCVCVCVCVYIYIYLSVVSLYNRPTKHDAEYNQSHKQIHSDKYGQSRISLNMLNNVHFVCLLYQYTAFYYARIKCTLVQVLRLCTGRTAHRGSRGIALLFLDHGTRRGWVVSVTPRPLFTPG